MQENHSQDFENKPESDSSLSSQNQNNQPSPNAINLNRFENPLNHNTLPLQSQNTSKPLTRHSSLKLLQVKQRQTSSKHLLNQTAKKKLLCLSQSIKKRPTTQNETYTDWKVYHHKSELKILPFPYCVEESNGVNPSSFSPLSLFTSLKNPFKDRQQQKKQSTSHFPKLYKLKIDNKAQVRHLKLKQNSDYKPIFNFQKTPINEFLNYDLAQEINTGLRDVQILADENRKIRKAKKENNEHNAKEKTKLTGGIKVKRQYIKNYKDLFKK